MIKKEKFHDDYGRPTYLLGLGEGTYTRYYVKKNISGDYEFWNCDFKLEDLDYSTIIKSVLTEDKFQKLKETLFIYHTAKDIAIIHRTIPRFKDNERACDYEMVEIEMEDEIRKLLEQ